MSHVADKLPKMQPQGVCRVLGSAGSLGQSDWVPTHRGVDTRRRGWRVHGLVQIAGGHGEMSELRVPVTLLG
jgi:hypothetical protein